MDTETLFRRIVPAPPPDPGLKWRGTPTEGRPFVRLALYSDCSFRRMELSHWTPTPVGWPERLGEHLDRQGTGLEFSTVFVGEHRHYPPPHDLGRYLKLTGDPDLVMVQTGRLYSRHCVFPDTRRTLEAREYLAHRLGPRVFAGYKALRPFVRAFGRPVVEYPGAHRLERFLEDAKAQWPQARIVVVPPFPRVHPQPMHVPIDARTHDDMHAAAQRAGVEWLDLGHVLGDDPALRCANGYNLNAEGSRRFGDALAQALFPALVTTGHP